MPLDDFQRAVLKVIAANRRRECSISLPPGAPIAPEDWPIVTTYLTKNFPEPSRPSAVLIPGPAQVAIKMWDVPTLGSRPRRI